MHSALLATSLFAVASAQWGSYNSTEAWTMAITNNGPCKQICYDRVVQCSGAGKCESPNVFQKQRCTSEGWNTIINCANCCITNGLIFPSDVNQTLADIRQICTIDYGGYAVASTSAVTALSPTATGGQMSIPSPSSDASQVVPAWKALGALAALAIAL